MPRARSKPRPEARPRARGRGFTLVEVLVALVIMSFALIAALRAAMLLTDGSDDMRRRYLATLVAQNRLVELRLAGGALAQGTERFECDQGGVRFTCEQEVLPTPNPFFRRVEVRVFGDPARDGRLLSRLLTVLRNGQ